MEYAVFRNGVKMPMLGLGVFRVTDETQCRDAVYEAIKAGYRMIDTAAAYHNEAAVGEGLRKAVAEGLVTREEMFITSKVWVTDMGDYEHAKKAVDRSLETCGLEYFDLYLLHQAMGDYFAAWRALEDAYEEGKVRAIGISNFYPFVVVNFCEHVRILPMLNQIETHPFFTQEPALKVMNDYGIVPQAWAPLGSGLYDIFSNELLKGIAEKYGKTVGQAVLRWNIQRGVAVIPKSVHRERIIENLNVFDFRLTDEEMKEISSLDMGYTGVRIKHLDPDYVRNSLKG